LSRKDFRFPLALAQAEGRDWEFPLAAENIKVCRGFADETGRVEAKNEERKGLPSSGKPKEPRPRGKSQKNSKQ
jgi:hypothetical protein